VTTVATELVLAVVIQSHTPVITSLGCAITRIFREELITHTVSNIPAPVPAAVVVEVEVAALWVLTTVTMDAPRIGTVIMVTIAT
jgi:hypothetical protein